MQALTRSNTAAARSRVPLLRFGSAAFLVRRESRQRTRRDPYGAADTPRPSPPADPPALRSGRGHRFRYDELVDRPSRGRDRPPRRTQRAAGAQRTNGGGAHVRAQQGGDATVLIFDLGVGTLDVTLIEVGEGVVEVRRPVATTTWAVTTGTCGSCSTCCAGYGTGTAWTWRRTSRRASGSGRPPRQPRWSCRPASYTTGGDAGGVKWGAAALHCRRGGGPGRCPPSRRCLTQPREAGVAAESNRESPRRT